MGLISVQGDSNSHGGGILSSSGTDVFIEGKGIVNLGTQSGPDSLCPIVGENHCSPNSSSGSLTVFSGGLPIHRNGDSRTCGASTIVSGQSSVFSG